MDNKINLFLARVKELLNSVINLDIENSLFLHLIYE